MVTAILAGACGIVAIVTRPFLLAPIGLILLLFSARQSENQRFTLPVASLLALCAFAGAAIAAGYGKPLY